MMRPFDSIEYDGGLTPDQRERTNAFFARAVCQNIDWISYQAHRTRDEGYVEELVGNYKMFALQQAHNSPCGRIYFPEPPR